MTRRAEDTWDYGYVYTSHYLHLFLETYLMSLRHNSIARRSYNGCDLRSSSDNVGSGLFDNSIVVDLVAIRGVRFLQRREGYSSARATFVNLRDGIVDEICERAKVFHGEVLMRISVQDGLFLYVSRTTLDA